MNCNSSKMHGRDVQVTRCDAVRSGPHQCYGSVGAGGVRELGFWEVNEATLKDVHEVAPTQEEMQAAADAASSPEVMAFLMLHLAIKAQY